MRIVYGYRYQQQDGKLFLHGKGNGQRLEIHLGFCPCLFRKTTIATIALHTQVPKATQTIVYWVPNPGYF